MNVLVTYPTKVGSDIHNLYHPYTRRHLYHATTVRGSAKCQLKLTALYKAGLWPQIYVSRQALPFNEHRIPTFGRTIYIDTPPRARLLRSKSRETNERVALWLVFDHFYDQRLKLSTEYVFDVDDL